MSFKTVALLALAVTALAHPKKDHRHHHHGTGTGAGGFAFPTGGPYPSRNHTHGGSGAGSSEVAPAVVTMTVSPLPAAAVSSSPAGFAAPSDTSAAVNVVNAAAVAPGTSIACSSSSTFTATVTSVQYYSVTVTADNLVAAVSASSSLDLSTSALVAAGDGFFQRPSYSGNAPSSMAFSAAPTTFATSTTPGAVVPSMSSSYAPAASSSASTSPSTGTSGKKGLSYNTPALTDLFAGTGMTWAYNWASSSGGAILPGLEYVPMLWGQSSISGWSSAAQSAISSGSSHLLSFNEPDLSSQSNLSPSTAAQLHIANMNPFSGQAQIGSPAITNGAGSSPPMGTTWLQQFFEACNGQCKVDFVAFHYYNDAGEIDDFMSHVQEVISTAQANGVNQVWLTEFGVTGTDSAISSFLSQALTFLDGQSAVERYAYFMCGDGTLLTGTALNAIGEVYAS